MPSPRLAERECVPCSSNTPTLSTEEIASLKAQIHRAWYVADGRRLQRDFRTADFVSALALVNRLGAVAESLNHHPDLSLAWGRVGVTIWTHTIDGLSEIDFVFAAKCDEACSEFDE